MPYAPLPAIRIGPALPTQQEALGGNGWGRFIDPYQSEIFDRRHPRDVARDWLNGGGDEATLVATHGRATLHKLPNGKLYVNKNAYHGLTDGTADWLSANLQRPLVSPPQNAVPPRAFRRKQPAL